MQLNIDRVISINKSKYEHREIEKLIKHISDVMITGRNNTN